MLPKTLQAITNAVGYPLQPNGKTLLLKTPLTHITEHREIKLVLNLKLQPYWLAFMVLEDHSCCWRGKATINIT